ncbi:hypothetical protein BC834DRAFT_859845 [Gloeopeniophorella convolvens]|nr:hypothetical protein BC834DRAFT_859845 [Gloeopeniophorella convolvens]
MAKRNKSSLKAALSSAQDRLGKRKHAEHAAQAATQKARAAKGGRAKAQHSQRPSTVPFAPEDSILLVGEGNFSFARALVLHPPASLEHLPPANVTATAYDTEEACYAKYPDAEACVRALRDKGARVLFGVDATRLEKTGALKGKTFDRIVWNFPHAGKGIADQDRNILSNQLLVLGFLRSAAGLLVRGPVPQRQVSRRRTRPSEEDDDDAAGASDSAAASGRARGTILVTLRNVPPYTEWDVPKLAKSPPAPRSATEQANPQYTLLRSFVFQRSEWKGYEHRMTKGERAHGEGKTGEGGQDRTWEFCLGDIEE